jgi:hypothetical protein
MERAFSPQFVFVCKTWGVAPGWFESRLWLLMKRELSLYAVDA